MKKKEILLAVAVIALSLVLLLVGFISDNKKSQKNDELNAIYGGWYDRDITDEENVIGRDMEFEPQEIYVTITNPSLIYDKLTLQALRTLRETCEEYLFTHGYKDARTLTIIEESIFGDKSYITFTCAIAEYPNTTLNVSYTVNDKQYEMSVN